LRILVLFAHPVETSFAAALHTKLVETLRKSGHEVDDCDLYAEGFNPVMSREERINYHEVPINRKYVERYVQRLQRAEALVFSFPVWNMGFPAILKGFIDRVFITGVTFRLEANGDYVPTMHNIKKLGVVCTYGGARLLTFLMGDPPRRFLKRSLRATCAPGTRCDFVALHDMDHKTQLQREAFLRRVETRFSGW